MSNLPLADVLPPIDEILSHLTVRDIMTTDLVTVRPSTPVIDLLELLVDAHISGMPVVADDGRTLGVVSATDVMRLATFASDTDSPAAASFGSDIDGGRVRFFLDDRAAREGEEDGAANPLEGWTVADIMTPTAFTVTPDASLPELARLLFRGQIHRALVTHDGDLLGIVTAFDLVRAVAASQDG